MDLDGILARLRRGDVILLQVRGGGEYPAFYLGSNDLCGYPAISVATQRDARDAYGSFRLVPTAKIEELRRLR